MTSPDRERIAGLLRDDSYPDRLRAMACRLVAEPDRPEVVDVLIELSRHRGPALRAEAVRTMTRGSGRAVGEALSRIARDREAAADLRADALVGLARQPADRLAEVAALLDDPEAIVRIEAARALRPVADEPEVRGALTRALGGSDSPDGWAAPLAEGGDPDAGRRVFLHPTLACSDCHRVEGRGGAIGPDLRGYPGRIPRKSRVSHRSDWMMTGSCGPKLIVVL